MGDHYLTLFVCVRVRVCVCVRVRLCVIVKRKKDNNGDENKCYVGPTVFLQ